jgi:hypothetical protein
MIWGFALGGQKIRMGPVNFTTSFYAKSPAKGTAQIHFDLLRVCRQVYAEAAPLPRTLNTPYFSGFSYFEETFATGRLRHVQMVCLQAGSGYLARHLQSMFPVATFEQFKTVEIVLLEPFQDEGLRSEIRTALRAHLPNKEVKLRFSEDHQDMMWHWGQS